MHSNYQNNRAGGASDLPAGGRHSEIPLTAQWPAAVANRWKAMSGWLQSIGTSSRRTASARIDCRHGTSRATVIRPAAAYLGSDCTADAALAALSRLQSRCRGQVGQSPQVSHRVRIGLDVGAVPGAERGNRNRRSDRRHDEAAHRGGEAGCGRTHESLSMSVMMADRPFDGAHNGVAGPLPCRRASPLGERPRCCAGLGRLGHNDGSVWHPRKSMRRSINPVQESMCRTIDKIRDDPADASPSRLA